MHEKQNLFVFINFFAMFCREPDVLILDLYLYGIKYKPVLIKICKKINNVFKDFSEFFIYFLYISIYINNAKTV
jgi:hypothetical protein